MLLFFSSPEVAGALAATVGPTTLSATGAVAVQGAAAATLDAVALSGAGTVAVQGELTGAVGAVTLEATASVPVQGALAGALGAVALAATGAVAVQGELAASLEAVTLAGAGGTGAQGTLAATLGAVTAALTGTVPIEGDGTLGVGAVALSAAGTIPVAGALAGAVGDVTGSAAGAVAIQGSLAATMGAVTLAAAATAPLAGALTGALGAVALSATGSGTAEVTGDLAATLAPVTLAATCESVTRVARGRDAAVVAFPFVVLREPDAEAIEEESGNAIVYELAVEVECYCQEKAATASDNPDTRIGATLNGLYGRMLATVLANPSLGGVVDDVRETGFTPEFNTEDYSTPAAVGVLGLAVRYADNGTTNRRQQVLTQLATYLADNTDPPDTTRREVMLAALQTQLEAELPGTVTVERNRRAKVDGRAITLRHVCLRDGEQEAQHDVVGFTHYLAHPVLELTVRAATEDALGPAMDQLYADVRAALYADRTLGGAAFSLTDRRLDVTENAAVGSAPVLRATLTLDVEYLTDEADPTRAAA